MPQLVDILQYKLTLDDKEFTSSAGKADAAVNQLAGSIGGQLAGALGVLAGAFSAAKIADFIKDATMTAARTEVLGTVLNVVGKNAGVSLGQLALLEEQVKSLGITTQGARESIIKFIQSGLPLTKVAELARLAQDSAVVAGINSAEALDRLVRGIQTGQIELLRSAGVFVSIEGELNKFAKSSGKAREGLSDLERQTVILNAVLAQGEKLAGNYEAAMGDVGKQVTSLPRLFEEFQNAMGQFFLPVMQEGVTVATDLLKALTALQTNDAIERARKAAGGTGDINAADELNRLLEERRRLGNQIFQNESLSNAVLVNTYGIVSDIAKLFNIGFSLGTEKQKRDLEEINRLIAAIQEKAFVGPIDQTAQIEAARLAAEQEAAAKKAEDRAKRLAAESLKAAQTPTADFTKQWNDFMDEIERSTPIPVGVIINVSETPLQPLIDEIEQKFSSIRIDPETGFPFGPMTTPEFKADVDEAAQIAKDKLSNAFRDVSVVGSVIANQIGAQFGQVFDSIMSGISSFSTGDIAGGIAGVVGGLFAAIGGTQDKLIASQRDLIDAIDSWKNTVLDLSDNQRAEQQRAIDQTQALIVALQQRQTPDAVTADFARQILENAGITVPENATSEQLLEILNALDATLADTSKSFDQIVGAITAQQRQSLVTGTSGADEALRIISTITDIFDLNLEEQQSLLQTAFDDLAARGLLSDADKTEFFTRLENIDDSIQQGNKDGFSQTERSIARVSERQADSLISGLMTMDIHLVDGFKALNAYLDELLSIGRELISGRVAMGGGGDVVINNYFSGGNQAEIESTVTKAVNNGLRAAGGTRLGSR